ncbi:MAG: YjbH domain-containing protein [Rikenellaceae bacterium]|nr:YjbH domain-containing protein [Rikenellaceae bacterium]
MKKLLISISMSLLWCYGFSQSTLGMTGLLNSPSAEKSADGLLRWGGGIF